MIRSEHMIEALTSAWIDSIKSWESEESCEF